MNIQTVNLASFGGAGIDSQPVVRAPRDESMSAAAVTPADQGKTANTAAANAAQATVSAEQVHNAVKDLNSFMKQTGRNLEFSVDSDTHRMVVKLTDAETGETLLQIPSDETLAMSRAIDEFQQGALVRQKA